MPKLWDDSIQAHRRAVREAIMDTTWALVCEHGPTAVTMSQIAEHAGIGRATLYKYFADVDAILRAWHRRRVAQHLTELAEVGARPASPGARLEAVLSAYAFMSRHHHSSDLTAMLHRDPHVEEGRDEVTDFVRGLLAVAAAEGDIRSDISPAELAPFCVHALSAASDLPSDDAIRRLVALTMTSLRPQVSESGPDQA